MAPGPLRGLTRKQSKVLLTDVTQHVVNVSGERDGGVDEMGPLARPYPPSQSPGSFNLSAVEERIRKAVGSQ
jgi:hypothetical protein